MGEAGTMCRRHHCSRCHRQRLVVLVERSGRHRIPCRSCGHVDVVDVPEAL